MNCETAPCTATVDPVTLLTDDEQVFVARDHAGRARVDAWVARSDVRAGLAALGLLEDGPTVVVLFAVGAALRRLGGRGEHTLARAIPWLRHASRAAIAWAILSIFIHGLRSLLLSPGTQNLRFPIDLDEITLPLLLSTAAYAIAWALEAGLRAQRDLDDFV